METNVNNKQNDQKVNNHRTQETKWVGEKSRKLNIQDINYGIQEKVKLEIELGIIINNLEKSLIFGGSQLNADFGIHRTLIIEDLELQPMIVQLADFIVHRVLLIDANSTC